MRREIPSGAGKGRAVAIHDRSPRGRVFPLWRRNPRLEGGRRPVGVLCGDCKRRYCLYTGILQHSAAYDPSHHAKLRKGTSPYGKADNRSTSYRLNWLALGRRARPEDRDGCHDAGTQQTKHRKETTPKRKADNRTTTNRLNWLALGRRARPEDRDGCHDAGTLQSVNFKEINRRRRHYSCRWKLVVDIAAGCEGVARRAGGGGGARGGGAGG